MSIEEKQEGMSRRSLLTGAAMGALGIAGAGLLGCAPNNANAPAPTATAPADPGTATTAGPDIAWDEEFDIVVVGSGGGLAGGIAAAEAGCSVIVLEKDSLYGGSTNLHSGVFACGGGTSIQKEAGFTDTPEAYEKYMLACAKGQANPDIIKLLSVELAKTYEWAAGLGVPFTTEFLYCTGAEVEPYCTAVTPAVPHAVQVAPSAEYPLTGPLIHKYVMDEADRLGVETRIETPALRLILGEDGGPLGVVANSKGKEVNIKAKKGVLLASGGMAANPEMCHQYMRFGEIRIASGAKQCTGDGIKMGQSAGGDLMNMMESLQSPSTAVPFQQTTRGKTRASFPTIMVNKFGRRFVNEDYHSDSVGTLANGQEDGIFWQIFDSASYAAVADRNKEALIEADTIEELAQKTEIQEYGLVQEINSWNEHAANGEDPAYGKSGPTVAPLSNPPYYAFKSMSASLVVQYGGLVTNTDFQVQHVDGHTIPRLYAAGLDAGGWLGRQYPGSGHAVGGTYAMSRIAVTKACGDPSWDEA